MPVSHETQRRLLDRLTHLYGDAAEDCLARLLKLVEKHGFAAQDRPDALWDEKDVVLITYGDQVRQPGGPPLAALRRFLADYGLDELFSTVHILPFFPYSSDDGFSVIDYRQVDPALGKWDDVAALGEMTDLMFDLVLNHCSQQHEWFQRYLKGDAPYDRYFIEMDPRADLSAVTRPRSLPLLTPYETSRGTKHVWTTFSADQVDLNFAEPAVLLEMLDVLLEYVQRGARIIRLDAIAYLWKEPGTSCIHLPRTHTVVKLMRDLLDAVAPRTLLLTETNVPHAENVSYFGAGDEAHGDEAHGDEAHMVYQFSLAPLLLDAALNADATILSQWLRQSPPPPENASVLNFTASHDGIGVRPLEGLVPAERFDRLVQAVRERGGRVSTRRRPDGSDAPYELNITYFSALGEPERLDAADHARRFLSTQAVMLALRGIPAVYFHSLTGTPNDERGLAATGRSRSINRRKFERAELDATLSGASPAQRLVFDGYRRLLSVRRTQPSFHPDADQIVWDAAPAPLLVFERRLAGHAPVLSAANFSGRQQMLDLSIAAGRAFTWDLLAEQPASPSSPFTLPAFGYAWLTMEERQ